MNLARLASVATTIVLASAALVPVGPAQAVTDTGTPSQAEVDGAVSSSAQMATWRDYSGGVASRPFVTELSATTDGVTTTFVTGATQPGQQYPTPGQLTAIITPTNLCMPGQSGGCYTTPNRITVSLALQGNDNANVDLGAQGSFTADTVIDMTINLNSFGGGLRWTWMNGDPQYWRTTGIGANGALVRVRLKPSITPFVSGGDPAVWGCSATPITSCDVSQAGSDLLAASLVFSVDTTLSPALTGAAFATQGAIFGYLEPGGSATAPTLDLQVASTHTMASGAPQVGTLRAILPSNTLLNLYGVFPSEARTFFTTTRTGSAGTNGAIAYAEWGADEQGTDGLLVTVPQISFSVPVYNVSRTTAPAKVTSAVKGSRARLTIRRPKGCKAGGPKGCTATVYLVADEYSGDARRVKSVVLNKPRTTVTCPRGAASNYSVSVRTKRGKKLLTTAAGSFPLT